MKILILLLVVFSFSSRIEAKTLIVTDLDDTLKVTNVLDKTDAVYNALFSKKAFSGMPELMREFNNSDTAIYYVSGSPALISSKVLGFLEFNFLPQISNLYLKDLGGDTFTYKLSTITKIIQKESPDRIVLIGDDTEIDPEVYHWLSKKYNVDAIYIHSITNRELPKNEKMTSYFSSVEIAGAEMLKSTLTNSSLTRVASAFIKQANDSLLVIPGRYCPQQGRPQIEELKQRMSAQSTINLLEKVQNKIIYTCLKNNPGDDFASSGLSNNGL